MGTMGTKIRTKNRFTGTSPVGGAGPGPPGRPATIAASRAGRAEGQNPLENNAVTMSGIEARRTVWLNPSKGATVAPGNGRAALALNGDES